LNPEKDVIPYANSEKYKTDENFISDRIEYTSNHRFLIEFTRDQTVEKVSNKSDNEDNEGRLIVFVDNVPHHDRSSNDAKQSQQIRDRKNSIFHKVNL